MQEKSSFHKMFELFGVHIIYYQLHYFNFDFNPQIDGCLVKLKI